MSVETWVNEHGAMEGCAESTWMYWWGDGGVPDTASEESPSIMRQSGQVRV